MSKDDLIYVDKYNRVTIEGAFQLRQFDILKRELPVRRLDKNRWRLYDAHKHHVTFLRITDLFGEREVKLLPKRVF